MAFVFYRNMTGNPTFHKTVFRQWPGGRRPGSQKPLRGGWPLTLIVTIVTAAVLFYRWLPAVNLKSSEFWGFLFVVSLVFVGIASMTGCLRGSSQSQGGGPYPGGSSGMDGSAASGSPGTGPSNGSAGTSGKGFHTRYLIFLPVFFFLFPMIAGFLSGSRILHARAYSRILTVQDGGTEMIPSAEGTSSIALMDTPSAQMLGNREIGALSHVVSQYDVSSYTQLDYQGKPVKTSPLRYAGFFKWYRNRNNGIPGYVIVDPVKMDAEYVPLESGMKYVPSAWFGENLWRHVRFQYPTAMLSNMHFEIDEDGRPWYVTPVIDHKVGLFEGTQVIGAILTDPVTGQSQRYAAGDIPQWVDVVFDGDLICEQYNYYAQLHDGFLNSIFGQTGCRKVTEYQGSDDEHISDYGYIAKGGDIWIYTGVTSVNSDSSNIGFIMSNERTEETFFIPCAGADEFSAMSAAQGEVQEKRYTASFPSLILLDDEPTYIMVLKDASGLVKMYATVNVRQYNTVATAATQKDCIEKYRALMAGKITQAQANAGEGGMGELNGSGAASGSEIGQVSGNASGNASGQGAGITAYVEETEEDWQSVNAASVEEREIIVRKMQTIDRRGNTYLYVVDEDSRIYYARYEDVIGMLLVEEGDTITIRTDGEHFILP